MLVDEGGGGVSGGVLDDDNMIVGIVLLHNGIDVAPVPALELVVIGGHHNAEWQLLLVLPYLVQFVVVLVLGLGNGVGLPGRCLYQCLKLLCIR